MSGNAFVDGIYALNGHSWRKKEGGPYTLRCDVCGDVAYNMLSAHYNKPCRGPSAWGPMPDPDAFDRDVKRWEREYDEKLRKEKEERERQGSSSS